jgi:hypothetical protein
MAAKMKPVQQLCLADYPLVKNRVLWFNQDVHTIVVGIVAALGGYLVGQYVWQGRDTKHRPWRGEDGESL